MDSGASRPSNRLIARTKCSIRLPVLRDSSSTGDSGLRRATVLSDSAICEKDGMGHLYLVVDAPSWIGSRTTVATGYLENLSFNVEINMMLVSLHAIVF